MDRRGQRAPNVDHLGRRGYFLYAFEDFEAIHAGQPPDPAYGAVMPPIYQTSTFVFKNAAEGAEIFAGQRPGYIYTRLGNPTVKVLEAKMNALEGRDVKLRNPDLRVSSLAFSSGMSAVSSTLLALCSAGDTLILGDAIYDEELGWRAGPPSAIAAANSPRERATASRQSA
mgnify:CR=1 FL=1